MKKTRTPLSDRAPSADTSVRTSLLISYLVTLVLPVFLSLIVFIDSYRVTVKQADRVNAVTQQHLAALVDTYLDEAQSESMALILNKYSQSLASYTETRPTTRQIGYLSKLQEEMRFKTASSSYIQTMYAVFPRSDVILSDSGVYYEHNFTYRCRDDLGMTLSEWDDFLDFDGSRRLRILEEPDGSVHMLSAQKSLATSRGTAPDMLLVMNFDVSAFRDLLNGLSQEGSVLAMICDTESGGLVSSSVQPDGVTFRFEDGALIPGEQVMLSEEPIPFGPWICALLTPAELYFSTLRPLFVSAGLYFALSILGGLALSFYMSKRESSPVQTLSKRILAAVEQSPLEKNEYRQVQRALTELLRQRSTMEKENRLARRDLQTHVLRGILSERMTKDSPIWRHAFNSGIRLDSGRFAVAVYDVEDFGRVFSGIGTADSEGDELMDSVLDVVAFTVSQDAGSGAYTRYAVEIDERIACLICCPAEPETDTVCRDALRDTDVARRFLETNFSLILSAAVSQVHEGVENIQLCYREALETLDTMETMGIAAQSCLYSEICLEAAERSPVRTGILDREQQFCNLLKVGEFPAAEALLQEILEDLHLRSCPMAEGRMRMLGLIGAVGPALDEARREAGLEHLAGPEIWFQTKDISSMTRELTRSLSELTESAAQQQMDSSSQQREQFLEYTESHLTDPNLSVTMAAEAFEMSASYFSRLFKKSLGIGFLDYVHQNRLRLAKEKMRAQPDLPLKDIAKQVGYTTPLSLNRAFRKYEGVPPSTFRKKI